MTWVFILAAIIVLGPLLLGAILHAILTEDDE